MPKIKKPLTRELRFGSDRHAFKDFVLDQLLSIPQLEARPMFGGFGLYSGDRFFGIVWRDVLYFRTSPNTAKRYVDAGMDCFRPNPKQELRSYFEVPADVIERRSDLCTWATEALTT
ncbi:MAG: TfoX/Sxy family protein [Opitutaceae bacterium]